MSLSIEIWVKSPSWSSGLSRGQARGGVCPGCMISQVALSIGSGLGWYQRSGHHKDQEKVITKKTLWLWSFSVLFQKQNGHPEEGWFLNIKGQKWRNFLTKVHLDFKVLFAVCETDKIKERNCRTMKQQDQTQEQQQDMLRELHVTQWHRSAISTYRWEKND